MWTCPKCRRECDTPFCPICGYEKPTQISETDLLTAKVKKLQKKTKILNIIVILLTVVLIALSVFSFIKFDQMEEKVTIQGNHIGMLEMREKDFQSDIKDLQSEVYGIEEVTEETTADAPDAPDTPAAPDAPAE